MRRRSRSDFYDAAAAATRRRWPAAAAAGSTARAAMRSARLAAADFGMLPPPQLAEDTSVWKPKSSKREKMTYYQLCIWSGEEEQLQHRVIITL